MRLKIRCDGECENFCKIFWEVNEALAPSECDRVALAGHFELDLFFLLLGFRVGCLIIIIITCPMAPSLALAIHLCQTFEYKMDARPE